MHHQSGSHSHWHASGTLSSQTKANIPQGESSDILVAGSYRLLHHQNYPASPRSAQMHTNMGTAPFVSESDNILVCSPDISSRIQANKSPPARFNYDPAVSSNQQAPTLQHESYQKTCGQQNRKGRSWDRKYISTHISKVWLEFCLVACSNHFPGMKYRFLLHIFASQHCRTLKSMCLRKAYCKGNTPNCHLRSLACWFIGLHLCINTRNGRFVHIHTYATLQPQKVDVQVMCLYQFPISRSAQYRLIYCTGKVLETKSILSELGHAQMEENTFCDPVQRPVIRADSLRSPPVFASSSSYMVSLYCTQSHPFSCKSNSSPS